MLLPNSREATIDIRKLENYCLDLAHPLGRNKARTFRAALGIASADSRWLREAILAAIPSATAEQLTTDEHGTRFRIDIPW